MAKIPPFKPNSSHYKAIRKLALLGATLAQIADFFEITESQLSTALANDERLRLAKQSGGIVADAAVAQSMYRRALGYNINEEKAFSYMGDVEVVTVVKHIPADVNAAKFWLKNRQREDWREAPEPTQRDYREPWEIEFTE
jgi:hypothetical protein